MVEVGGQSLMLHRHNLCIVIDRIAGENTFGSVRVCACVCVSIRLSVCGHSAV